MADAVGVCNQALAELGQKATFVSFAGTDSVSVALNAIFPDTRDAVLQLTDWPFARYMATLTRSVTTPAFKWSSQFPLPTVPYCLQVLTTSLGYDATWEVGVDASLGRVIYANEPNLVIQYTGRVDTLTLWNPLAIRILVKMLAAELAKSVTGQTALAEEKLKEALALVPVGVQAAQRESHPVELYPTFSQDPSDLSVINQALVEAGLPQIRSLTEDTSAARDALAPYFQTKDAVLRLAPWDFATYMRTLTRSPIAPAFKWAYQHYLPDGQGEPFCLTVLTTSLGYEGTWEIGVDDSEGRVLYANALEVSIQYVGRVLNLGQWNSVALQVLIKMLASVYAKGKPDLAAEKLKEALGLLPVGAHPQGHPVEQYPPFFTEPTDLGLINQALGEVGLPQIPSLSDDTTAVREAIAPYFQLKDAVLQLLEWDFATFMSTLKRSDIPPAFKWTYQYYMPSGQGVPYLLRVLMTSAGEVGTWEVGFDPSEGRVIYSEETELSIQYTGRVENLVQWNSLAIRILVKMLAAAYAKGKPDLAAEKTKEAMDLLALAAPHMPSHAVGLFDPQPEQRDALQVMNQALIAVGAETVRSFDEDTKEAHEARVHYQTALDATLEMHPWNFASFRVSLIRSTRTPLFDWAHQFLLPDGRTTGIGPYCLAVRQTDGGNGVHFAVGQDIDDGRVLYSNSDTASIEYTGRVTDLSVWSSLAIQVFSKVLASYLAPSLSQDRTLGDRLLQQAFALLPVAKRSDGHEGHPVVLRANGGLWAARQSTGGRGVYVGIRTYVSR